MKKILFLLVPVFILAITGIFVSCDYLIPAPLGRDNPYDDEAQIGRFAVAASGPDSVVTVWDWRDPPSRIDDSRIIDKIRIVYSESDPPLSKYPFNQENVIEFTSNSDFIYEWKNLNEDRDHYFALYAHEKGGMWLAPKRADIWFDSNGYYEDWPWGNQKLYVSALAAGNIVDTAILDIVFDLTGPPVEANIGFMRFDDLFNYNYGAVVDAQIQGWNVTNGGDILIVPVRKRIEDGMSWGEIDNQILYDHEHAKVATITAAGDVVDIKDQINMARLYGSNTVAFITNDPDFQVGIDTLTFDNGVEILFSVWRSN